MRVRATRYGRAMSRTIHFDESEVEFARRLVRNARNVRDLRAALTVVMPAVCRVPNRVVAETLGISVTTVSRMQREIRDRASGKMRPERNWGGRRRQLMPIEEEKAFLDRWTAQAERGGVLVVAPIHAALEKKIGRPVARSTVYRMLARHGWRKVDPGDRGRRKQDGGTRTAREKRTPRKVWKRT